MVVRGAIQPYVRRPRAILCVPGKREAILLEAILRKAILRQTC